MTICKYIFICIAVIALYILLGYFYFTKYKTDQPSYKMIRNIQLKKTMKGLNENFKTVLKTISEIDQSSDITEFGAKVADIVNSSNIVLS